MYKNLIDKIIVIFKQTVCFKKVGNVMKAVINMFALGQNYQRL